MLVLLGPALKNPDRFPIIVDVVPPPGNLISNHSLFPTKTKVNLSPASMRPLTFLTVQKSRERRRMMRTKLPMKLSENHPHNRYTVG